MSSLLSSLDVALRSLSNQQLGLEITQKNIANVNTDGYTKESVDFQSDSPLGTGSSIYAAAGATLASFRNRYLDYSITQESQLQGEQDTISAGLQQVESILNESSDQGLQSALSEFFNSFSSLANAPEDTNLRQNVLSKAETLASEFQRVYDGVQQIQIAQNGAVQDTVDEINSITTRIADLNAKIGSSKMLEPDVASSMEDERQKLLGDLSKLVDVAYFADESGQVTVSTKQGTNLVVGNQSNSLQAVPSGIGPFLGVGVNGADITSTIQSGKLGGLLKLRDETLPGYLTNLDDAAATIIQAVNDQHALGFDYNGDPGGEFFTPLAGGSSVGAGHSISVAIRDPKLIAAAGAGGGVGSNVNALRLTALKDQKLFSSSTQTAAEFHASLISMVGMDGSRALASSKTQEQLLVQLKNQRDASSAVSLDEEAVNLLKYQKAYQASARFISVVDTLTNDLMQVLGA